MVSIERVDRHGTVPWIQTIYQTQGLTNQNGRAPERVVARQVAAGFDDIGRDCQIYYDYPAVQTSTEQATCSDPPDAHDTSVVDAGTRIVSDPDETRPRPREHTSAREEFAGHLEQPGVVVTQDSNLILTTRKSGGCATVGGNTASAGGGGIESDPGRVIENGGDDFHDAVSSAMHEIGHNAGNTHQEHAGLAWNAADGWHQTPSASRYNVPSGGGENQCGDAIPDRTSMGTVDELWFAQCQQSFMQVVDKQTLQGRPTNAPATIGDGVGTSLSNRLARLDGWDVYGGGGIGHWEWDMGDGNTVAGPERDYVYDDRGSYDVTLTVEGYDGTTDTATFEIDSTPGSGEQDDNGDGLQIGAEELAAAGGLAVLFALAVPEETRDQWIDRLTGQ